MELAEYFTSAQGTGVLATADADGNVDVAVYARPHVIDSETVAFLMADKLSHANLQSNPHAAYLFLEGAARYQGRRLALTKVREESDPQKIRVMRRRPLPTSCQQDDGRKRYLVYFHVDGVRPLVGDGEGEGA